MNSKALFSQGAVALSSVVVLALVSELGAAPVNDAFANRIVLSGTNITVTGSTVGATKEPGEPYHAGAAGGASVWWSWTAPREGTVTISTAGSSFDTVLGVYTGATVSALTEVASNDDDPNSTALTSKVVFDVVPLTTYQIAVDGYSGDFGSISLQVRLGPVQPPQQAPSWVLPDPYGRTIRSTDFTGQVVLLNFWATWCGPCRAEMPDIVALQTKYGPDGFAVLGVDVTSWGGDTASTVISFLSTFSPSINYTIVMSNGAIDDAYGGINAIPATFIIDRQNFIRKSFLGTQTGTTFEKAIVPLLYSNLRLASQKSGGQTALTWPATAAVFTLESSTTLLNPVWSTWPTPPTLVNGMNTVSISPTGTARYFRLRTQN